MKKTLKQWWNDWAPIDLISLGLSALSAVGYLYYKYKNPAYNEPWLEFWSNITTDLFFAWVTIRLIDVIIKRRDHREEVRRTLAGNLNYTIQIIQSFLPKAYQHDLERLKDELYWANRRFNGRKPFVNQEEESRLCNAYLILESLIEDATKLTTARQRDENSKRAIERQVRGLKKSREKLVSDFDKLRKEKISTLTEKDKVLKAREMINNSRSMLSEQEYSEIRTQLDEAGLKLEDHTEHPFFDLPHLNAYFENDAIYDPEISWLLEDLQEIVNQDYPLLLQRLQDRKSDLRLDNLPTSLHDMIEMRFNTVAEIINSQWRVDISSKNAIKALDLARDDILEETVID